MQIPKIEEQLLLSLLPKDEADERDIVLEVKSSAFYNCVVQLESCSYVLSSGYPKNNRKRSASC